MIAPDWVETRRRLLAFVLPRVASRDDAEDVVQDVLARMARDLDTLREGDRLNAWAYQIARNALADEHRRRGRLAAAFARAAYDLPKAAADPTSEPVVDADLVELTGCLQPLISSLPEPYRRALQLTAVNGMTMAQAAAAEAVSVSGMKSRVQRGRDRLRDALLGCCTPDRADPQLRGRSTASTNKPADGCGCGCG